MALFNADFSQTNDALQKALWIMMQNWLGKQGQQRSRETIEEQMKGYEALGQAGAVREQERMGKQHELSMKSLQQEFINEVSKSDKVQYFTTLSRKAALEGDAVSAKKHAEAATDAAYRIADAIHTTITGSEITPQTFQVMLEGIGIEQAGPLMREWGSRVGQKERLPLDIYRAETDRGTLLQKGQQNQVESGKEWRTTTVSRLTALRTFLKGVEDGDVLPDTISANTQKAVFNGRLTVENFGKAATKIDRLISKVNAGGGLSEQEDNWISGAWDTLKLEGMIKDEQQQINQQQAQVLIQMLMKKYNYTLEKAKAAVGWYMKGGANAAPGAR